jgi:hypothetical protein
MALFFLNEAWISLKNTSNLKINDYCVEHIVGSKSSSIRKGRFSGGISFYYRSNIKKNC